MVTPLPSAISGKKAPPPPPPEVPSKELLSGPPIDARPALTGKQVVRSLSESPMMPAVARPPGR